jgi:hypothetical protein
MSETTILRIAVLTDFHAYAGRPGDKAASPSWLDLSQVQSDPGRNAFAGLIEKIAAEQVTSDVLLCCGDLGDKADPAGQQYVWSEVEKVRAALGSRITLGAAGNHDVDSRYTHSGFDAKGQLQSLKPGFPVDDERGWLEYWAKNFTIVEVGKVRFVLLNSAAYHGATKEGEAPEYVHGRVSDSTISRLIAELESGGERVANVLVCHHHPFKNDKVAIPDYSQMQNGDKLINDLVAAEMGPWLVIHGHKHEGRLFYAQGGNSYPTVFAAGSFSAKPYPNQIGHTFNEFYVVSLEVPAALGEVSSLLGAVDTWSWNYGDGWRRPQVHEGLGPRAGFGARVDLGQLAKQIATALRTDHAGKPVAWREVGKRHGHVRHLVPDELGRLLGLLTKYHNLSITRDNEHGEIAEVQVP